MLNYPNYSANLNTTYNAYGQGNYVPYQQNQFNAFNALGRVVENVDTVKMAEIPYQGVYYFPTADGKTIYSKQWTQNGQTQISAFKQVLEDNPNNTPSDDIKMQFGEFSDVLGAIQNDLKVLSDKVDKISKPDKAKKGGSDE